jgi:N-acetylglucosaminyldiphosphoundecaprenol N-acetyl-beta-D-mannosaminyltransferase
MLLNYNITKQSLDQIDFETKRIINTINPHSYCIAEQDLQFKQALLSSDILLPDGVGIVLAERFLNGNLIKKIAGYDLFLFLMNKLNNENGSVFFLGASKETLEKIKSKSFQDYPNITFGSYSPPYKVAFSNKDSKIMCDEVNLFNPDVLFVGMTAPKQEKWIHEFKNHLEAKNICAIGAVFDFYAGNVNRAPEFIVRLGLEWFHRSMKSKRLFKRNFISNPKFILHILKLKFFIKKIK